MSDHARSSIPRPPWFIDSLVLTTVVCGALVMVVEILGSEVIGPYDGVSVFIWTSPISVTLVQNTDWNMES